MLDEIYLTSVIFNFEQSLAGNQQITSNILVETSETKRSPHNGGTASQCRP
jgi:hypothetical protein